MRLRIPFKLAVEPHKEAMHKSKIMQSEQNINETFINLTNNNKSTDGATQWVVPSGASVRPPMRFNRKSAPNGSSPVSGDCRIGRDRTGIIDIGRFINLYLSISMHSVPIVFVNPKGTSRTCSRCGAKGVVKGRVFVCKKCGLKLDRDLNASRNIAKRGFHTEV